MQGIGHGEAPTDTFLQDAGCSQDSHGVCRAQTYAFGFCFA